MIKGIVKLVMLAVMSLYLPTMLVAQESEKSVTYKIDAPKELKLGQDMEIKVTFDMGEGWYIYAPTESNIAKGLILSGIKFIAPEGMKIGEVKTPKPSNNSMADIYKGKGVIMTQRLISTKELVPGVYKIKGTVNYQACNSDYCEPPRFFPVMLKINIVEK